MKISIKDISPVHSENHRGGGGTTTFYHCLDDYHSSSDASKTEDHITCVVLVKLDVGAWIKEHVHDKDEEVYIITSGEGLYNEDGGAEMPITEGDVLILRKGHSHGIRNTGATPLLFYAVVAR